MDTWFTDCHTLDEVRAEYRRLCFVHHPDHGGDTLVMQAINVAYDQARQKLSAPRSAQARSGSRRHWQRPTPRPASGHPNDGPPPHGRTAAPEREPLHSRDYFQSIWSNTPWQQLERGGYIRQLWQHQVVVFQHSDPKFERAWFVMLDNVFSPYFYNTRSEAEQAAFELLYDKVKFLDT